MPMTTSDRRHRDEEWRDRITDAARRSLSAKGFHGTTIDDISRMSFTPKNVLHRSFASKDALLNETVLKSSRATLSLVRQALQATDSEPGTVQKLIELMTPLLTSPGFFDIGRFSVEWWAWASRNETGLQGFLETWREWRAALTAIIRAEVGDGASDADVMAMAALMLAIYNGLVLHATLEGDELDVDAIMRFQQLGWEGIFHHVKAQAGSDTPGDADSARAVGETT
jgi:AcrR family transcriptional regulator